MSRIVLAATMVAAFSLAACGAAPVPPTLPPASSAPPMTPAPPASPADPSAEPSVPPPANVPSPRVTPLPADPGSLDDFTVAERYLFDGVLRGATECQPAGGSDDRPRDAIAGIECASSDPAISRIGFYLFENDAAMVDAHVWRMTAEGVALDSGSCSDGEAEGAYTPGEGMIPSRSGCFIDGDGIAIYRATLPGSHVSINIRGLSADMRLLEDFAWFGNQDTPGSPTLWGEPS